MRALLGICMVLAMVGACSGLRSLSKEDDGYSNAFQPIYSYVELLRLDQRPLYQAFYPTETLGGDPSLILTREGLIYNQKVLCSWQEGAFNQAHAYSQQLVNCPPGLPVETAFGGGGTGDVMILVNVEQLSGNLASVLYNGQRLFTFLGWEQDWQPATHPAGRKFI
jgi:hypothetical protein